MEELWNIFNYFILRENMPELQDDFISISHKSMAKRKTTVTPLVIHRSYRSLALNHRNEKTHTVLR